MDANVDALVATSLVLFATYMCSGEHVILATMPMWLLWLAPKRLTVSERQAPLRPTLRVAVTTAAVRVDASLGLASSVWATAEGVVELGR